MKKEADWPKLLISGFVLLRTFTYLFQRDGLPLFNFLADDLFQILRQALAVLIFTLWFREPNSRLLYLVSMANIAFQFCMSYSNVGAFSMAPFFLFLFAYTVYVRKLKRPEFEASFLLCFIFLSAAIQKMNSNYLSGVEFLPQGTFRSYVEYWAPDLAGVISVEGARALAALSIFIEICLALGALVLPGLSAVLSLCFVLLLSLFHPPVFYVFIFILPISLAMWPKLVAGLPELQVNHVRIGAIATSILLAIVAAESTSLTRFPYLSVGASALLLVFIVGAIFVRSRHYDLLRVRSLRAIGTPSIALTLVFVFTLIGSKFFLPSPLGFSMFSGNRFQIRGYSLRLNGSSLCSEINRKWRFSLATDADIKFTDGIGCELRFPTCSGIKLLREKVCEIDENQSVCGDVDPCALAK